MFRFEQKISDLWENRAVPQNMYNGKIYID